MIACNATDTNYFLVQQPTPAAYQLTVGSVRFATEVLRQKSVLLLKVVSSQRRCDFCDHIRDVRTNWCISRSCYKSANFCQVQLHLAPALSVGLVLIRSSAPTTIHRGFHVRWWRLAVSALCTAFQLGSQTCCASSPWTPLSDRSAMSLTGPLRWQNCRADFPEPINSFRLSSCNFVETLLPVA